MKRQRSWLIILVLLIAGAALSGWLYAAGAGSAVPAGATGLKGDGTVSGVVVNATGPLAGARVRVRATANLTFTDANGNFLLANVPTGQQIEVASWYTGHYIASAFVTPTVSGLTLTLRAYHTTDHPEYPWTSPISTTGPGACGNCHPMIIDQWTVNAHGGAVTNPRFFSLYDGTDVSGTTTISPGYHGRGPLRLLPQGGRCLPRSGHRDRVSEYPGRAEPAGSAAASGGQHLFRSF
jgi:hypothetical protein